MQGEDWDLVAELGVELTEEERLVLEIGRLRLAERVAARRAAQRAPRAALAGPDDQPAAAGGLDCLRRLHCRVCNQTQLC